MNSKRNLLVAFLVMLLAPALWAGFAGTDVYLPSVGSGSGAQGSHWFTSVWIFNPGVNPANATLYFLARGSSNASAPSASIVIQPGETIRIPDLMGDIFGTSSAFGALRVSSNEKILVASRIFSLPQGSGEERSTGQFFSGIPSSFSIGPGESTKVLGAMQNTPLDTGPFRYNFGFVETTGHAAVVRVTAFNGFDPTSPLGSKDYSLGPYGAIQKSLSDVIPSPNGDNIVLKIEVLSGPGQILAFGSQITNDSNDPSTFEMQFADSLLGGGSSGGGLTAVAHDGTLTGDGTAGSPLGVADGAITTAKLSASGSSAGQVLTSTGTGVAWQTPSGGGGGSFALPYAGSTASDGDAFRVSNTGNGRGIVGESSNHDGVTGKTAASTRSGVYGASSTQWGYGVFGRNQENTATGFLGGTDDAFNGGVNVAVGAFGRADGSAGQIGVLGISQGGTGVAGKELNSGCNGILGGEGYGVMGVAEPWGGSNPYAVWGVDNTGGVGFAGSFSGDVGISGSLLVQGSKNFRIDHPLDPAGAYLDHAAIESDEVLNQYTGNVVLDENGRAVVSLPAWFEAINTDFRYQLTAIGAAAPNLHVSREVEDGRFEIAGGSPGLKVSWQITARRNDPYLRAHPFTAEHPKPERERGFFLFPEGYGQPAEKNIEWARHPEAMRRLKEQRLRDARARE